MKRAFSIRFFAPLLGLSLLALVPFSPDADAEGIPPTESSPAVPASQPAAEITIPNPELKIVINIPTYQLFVYEKGQVVKEYAVAVGQPKYPSPTGAYNVGRIEWNPWWYPPDSPWAEDAEVTPPGPGNPLGPVKMVMEPDLRVHGTNKDHSVGRPASHGCFRMHNNDAKELAWYLQSRSSMKNDESLQEKYRKNSKSTFVVKLDYPVPVEITYEPVFVTAETIEIHPDLYWKIKKIKDKVLQVTASSGLDPKIYDETKLAKIKRTWKTQYIPIADLLPEIAIPKVDVEKVSAEQVVH
jgi:hypothetical protein